jgi:hypothetical protein
MNSVVYAVTKQQAERLRELDNEEEFYQDLETVPRVEVSKQWHGLHYLLTGTAAGVSAPEGFLLDGGEGIGPDGGYGAARLFSPREVDDIHSAIVDIGDEGLWSRFNPGQMNADQVYPSPDWHEEPEITRTIYLVAFRELKAIVDQASRRGQYLLVTLG